MTFRHWDIKESVPEDLVGAYDIVHVRFLAYVVRNDEIADIAAKLASLLRPGGHLQWEEADLETLRFETTAADGSGSTENLRALFSLLAVQDARLRPTWFGGLHELVAGAGGLVDVERDVGDAPPHLAFMFHETGLMIHELIARKTRNEQMAAELRRLLPAAVEETRLGAYVTALRYTVIGRKP